MELDNCPMYIDRQNIIFINNEPIVISCSLNKNITEDFINEVSNLELDKSWTLMHFKEQLELKEFLNGIDSRNKILMKLPQFLSGKIKKDKNRYLTVNIVELIKILEKSKI